MMMRCHPGLSGRHGRRCSSWVTLFADSGNNNSEVQHLFFTVWSITEDWAQAKVQTTNISPHAITATTWLTRWNSKQIQRIYFTNSSGNSIARVLSEVWGNVKLKGPYYGHSQILKFKISGQLPTINKVVWTCTSSLPVVLFYPWLPLGTAHSMRLASHSLLALARRRDGC